MASEKAYEAMKRDDWNIVMEMLDEGELSTADINKLHDGLRHDRVRHVLFADEERHYFRSSRLYLCVAGFNLPFSLLSTGVPRDVADLRSTERSGCHCGSTSACRRRQDEVIVSLRQLSSAYIQ